MCSVLERKLEQLPNKWANNSEKCTNHYKIYFYGWKDGHLFVRKVDGQSDIEITSEKDIKEKIGQTDRAVVYVYRHVHMTVKRCNMR